MCKAGKTKYGKSWLGRQMFVQRERRPEGRRDERKMCNVCVSQERLPLTQAPCVWQGVDSPKGQQQKKKGAGHGSPLNYSELINYLSLSLLFLEGLFYFRGEMRTSDQEP